MSSGRLHIPFPRTFLSLNTPTKKSFSPGELLPAAAPEPQQSAHPFLSNRAVAGARHASFSSIRSDDSLASSASATTSSPSASPVLAPTVPAFLSLNAKYAAPPKTAKEMTEVEKHAFLSNKH